MTQVTSALMESTSAGDEREVLVRVEGVSKKFCRSLKKSLWYGVQDIAAELVGRSGGEELRADEFWAVKDVSFELRRGECLGLIGRNGAGKSTLLRMLNGLIKPDQGRIEINGKVGGLIALGAGFNPVLTGRENVYVNGSILGLSKGEIDAKLEEIIEFAEIGEFMDAPVQTYSSGMSVRLGFAVAAMLIKPDVLLLDEVLAVGDIGFAIKCLNIIQKIAKDSSVIFISHNMQWISWFCTRLMLLESGRISVDSQDLSIGFDKYMSLLPVSLNCFSDGSVSISNIKLSSVIDDKVFSESLGIERIITQNSQSDLYFEVINQGGEQVKLDIMIMSNGVNPIINYSFFDAKKQEILIPLGVSKIKIDLGNLELNSGQYSFTISLFESKTRKRLLDLRGVMSFRIKSRQVCWGNVVRNTTLEFL